MKCENESLVKSAQFVIIIQTQMQVNSHRLLCMPQPGPSCSHEVTTEKSEIHVQRCWHVHLYIKPMASFVCTTIVIVASVRYSLMKASLQFVQALTIILGG